MNNLSWLIYLANVVNSFQGWAIFTGIIGGLGSIFSFVWWLVVGFNPNDKSVQASIPFLKSFRRLFVGLLFISVPLSILIPDRQTIILIAGSQLGERLMKSEEVKGVVDPGLDLVKAWIAKETAKLKLEKEAK